MNALELKIPPLVLTLVFAGAMWVGSALLPSLVLPLPWRLALAVVLTGLGIAVALAGVLAFRNADTTVNPTQPSATSAMVTSGVYRVSRNPMYVGFLLVLLGWATLLAHAFAFILLPVFVAYMNRFQISAEERALSLKFGSQFATYKQSVRRWL